jgi:tRNA (5-methylaminomethyl-2-thiouridylate)-methyltransferase
MVATLVAVRHAVLLSGGVDSSVALLHVIRSNASSVTAYYLKVWLEDELDYVGSCPWEEDLGFARDVCDQLGVELRIVPLQLEYHERVVRYAIEELKAGRTPSPDIFCNQRVKFGAFYDYLSREHPGEEWRIVTGHYGRVRDCGDHVELLRALDPVKDQSYFLSHVSQEQLRRIEMPIGAMRKAQVRAAARRAGLASSRRKDSQGICFLGKIRYPEFIRHYLGESPGPIIDVATGRTLGSHKGYWFHTIGQRQGLGLGGGPWYVVGKDIDHNTIFVSHSVTVEDQERSAFRIARLTWIWEPPGNDSVLVKIRHGPELTSARLRWLDDNTVEVTMERSDRGVAPGQFAVLYDGEVCLGSGTILEE